MPGETKSDISGWTVDTLHAHLSILVDERDQRYEERFSAQKQALESSLTAAVRAVDKAEDIAEKWRQNANEWRAAMSDKDKTYLTKDAADAKERGLEKSLSDIERRLNTNDGRERGLNLAGALLMGVIVAIGIVINILIRTLGS